MGISVEPLDKESSRTQEWRAAHKHMRFGTARSDVSGQANGHLAIPRAQEWRGALMNDSVAATS